MELASVQQWYRELRWVVEPECMSVLQSKSLASCIQPQRTSTRPEAPASGHGSAFSHPTPPGNHPTPPGNHPTHASNTSNPASPSSPVVSRSNGQNVESPVSAGQSPVSSNNSSTSLPRIKPAIQALSPKEHIDLIVDRAQTVSGEFTKLFRRIEKSRYKQVQASTLRIIQYLRSLIDDCDNAVHDPGPNIWEHEEAIIECCATLEDDLERLAHSEDPYTDVLLSRVTALGHSFGRLVDAVIAQLIQRLLGDLDSRKPRPLVEDSLDQLIKLSLDGEHMCFLIAREGGIPALFGVVQQDRLSYCWSLTLRTLAAVCCIAECVQELERVNGVDVLTMILDNGDLDESIRAESAGVIAQITSPCLDNARYLHGFLENIDNLVRSLTSLCDEASTPEIFLLGAAALANITFMDSLACDYLYHYHTARVLIDACQMHKADSLFAKDQVVTVLANMVTVDQCCVEICSCNGVELLVRFLRATPRARGELSGSGRLERASQRSRTELAASERVQQKTAVALTRLARNPDIAQVIVECGGVQRLVSMCQNPVERNKSDSVLMACVAALKRISRVCPDEQFTAEDVDKLLQSSLIDSFLSSNMEETFV